MQFKHIFLFGLLLALMATACEDAIDVTLDEAEPLLVVDAWLHDMEDQVPAIRLAYSRPYFDSTLVDGFSAAEVSVTTASGNTYDFVDNIGKGEYITNELDAWRAEPIGQLFTLNIQIGDVSYIASTEKFRVPVIDSIYQENRIDDPFSDDGIYCNFFATDPEGEGDTYWIKTYKNGEYLNRPGELNIAFDAGFSSSGGIDNLVFIQPIQELNNPVDDNFAPIPYVSGDKIRVEIHSISNPAFFYMEILRDQLLNSSNGIFAEPLANTNGNVTSSDGKEVLGFFNVSAVSVIEESIR